MRKEKYLSKEHEERYRKCINYTDERIDGYKEFKAFVYILCLSENCEKHIKELFDFSKLEIDLYGLTNLEWASEEDMALIRLALNLYSYEYPTTFLMSAFTDQVTEVLNYSPAFLFKDVEDEIREYMFEGIKIALEE